MLLHFKCRVYISLSARFGCFLHPHCSRLKWNKASHSEWKTTTIITNDVSTGHWTNLCECSKLITHTDTISTERQRESERAREREKKRVEVVLNGRFLESKTADSYELRTTTTKGQRNKLRESRKCRICTMTWIDMCSRQD